MESTSKWLSRKWIMGCTAFVLMLVLSLLSANTPFIVPEYVSQMLGGIAGVWLVTEGIMDYKKMNGTASSTTSTVVEHKETTPPPTGAPDDTVVDY